MRFSRWCCLGESDESPSRISFDKMRSEGEDAVVTLGNSATAYPPDEPAYEKIPRYARIQISEANSNQVTPVSVKTTPLQRLDDDQYSSLYAKIDRTKKTSSRLPTLVTRTAATPTQPPTVIETAYQRNTDFIDRYPHYEQVIVRESLQHRDQRLQMNDSTVLTIPLTSPQFASNNRSDYQPMSGSDIYAEIGNNSGSGTYYPPSVRSNDDLSERYATIPDHSEQPIHSSSNRPHAMQF